MARAAASPHRRDPALPQPVRRVQRGASCSAASAASRDPPQHGVGEACRSAARACRTARASTAVERPHAAASSRNSSCAAPRRRIASSVPALAGRPPQEAGEHVSIWPWRRRRSRRWRAPARGRVGIRATAPVERAAASSSGRFWSSTASSSATAARRAGRPTWKPRVGDAAALFARPHLGGLRRGSVQPARSTGWRGPGPARQLTRRRCGRGAAAPIVLRDRLQRPRCGSPRSDGWRRGCPCARRSAG